MRTQRLYGTDEPVSAVRRLNAGPLSVDLEDGQLRDLRWNGVEAIRGVAFLVRDENWGTYPVEISKLEVREEAALEAFAVIYEGRCGQGAQTLTYSARIEGTAQRLRFEATAIPSTDFATNRTGFVVLHPLEDVAGAPVEVEHVDGRRVQARFPELISPAQPFFDLRALTHQVAPGVRVRCLMEGDTFEMEDQRNWTDASFKTYVRPLSLPRPYLLPAGVPVRQVITLSFETAPGTTHRNASRTSAVALRLGETRGRMPHLGIGVPADQVEASSRVLSVLARLRPAWVVAQSPDAGTIAAAIGAQLTLELAVGEQGLAAIASRLRAAHVAPAAVIVSPEADLKSVPAEIAAAQAPSLATLYQEARQAFPGAQIGGGSLAFFTELNRKRPPEGLLDFVSHTTCPIVHAADDRSVMQTLQALPWVARTVRSFAGRAAYRVGPVALGMRQNPSGEAPAVTDGQTRRPTARRDPRQRGLFAAAFYAGYAAALAPEGVDTLTFCAPTGPDGVILEQPELQVVPAFHVLRALAAAGGHPQVLAETSDPARVRALAYRDALGTYVLMANLTDQATDVSLGFQAASIALLDENSVDRAAYDLDVLNDQQPLAGGTTIRLLPYAVALLRVG